MYNNPAVSVIIPLYNTEKYIGEALDSLLAQTFKDFEVIVVDDCSTDSSLDIVKSFSEKFWGRLSFATTQGNSTTAGKPSNIGLELSRGEYLFFMDNDDTVTPDALEKLYKRQKFLILMSLSAKNTIKFPKSVGMMSIIERKYSLSLIRGGEFVNEPTLINYDINFRVKEIVNHRFLWNLWTKIIRRDFVITEQIKFAHSNIIQDFIFTICLMVTAKKVVRVPYVINYYRVRRDSVSNKIDTPDK